VIRVQLAFENGPLEIPAAPATPYSQFHRPMEVYFSRRFSFLDLFFRDCTVSRLGMDFHRTVELLYGVQERPDSTAFSTQVGRGSRERRCGSRTCRPPGEAKSSLISDVHLGHDAKRQFFAGGWLQRF